MPCFQDLTLELARMVVELLEYDDIVPCMQTCRLLLAACSEVTLVFVRMTPTGPSRRTGSTLKLKLHPLSAVLETPTSIRLVTSHFRMPAGGYECDVYPRSRLRVSNTVNAGPSLHDGPALTRQEREAAEQARLKLKQKMLWKGRKMPSAAFPGRSAILDDFCYPACDYNSPFGNQFISPYDTRCLTERVAVEVAVFADGHWYMCDVRTLKWVQLHIVGCAAASQWEEEYALWFDDPTRATCDCKRHEEDEDECSPESWDAVDIGDRLSAAELKCTLRAGPCTVVLGLGADNTNLVDAECEGDGEEDGEGDGFFDPTVVGLHPTAKNRTHSGKGKLSLLDALVFVPSSPARPASHELGPRAARASAHVQHMVPPVPPWGYEEDTGFELSEARFVAL